MTLEYILNAAVNSMVRGHHTPHCYSAHVPGHGYVNKGLGPCEDRADYLRRLERDARSEVANMTWAEGYAEPGYDDPENGVVLMNWNTLPRELDDILERAGYGVEWSDEWSTCEGCNKLVRTSPDSYSWRSSYVVYNDCQIVCADCVRDDLDEYEAHLLSDANTADTLDVDWSARGFVKFNTDHYEHSFHPGQNDTPHEVVKHLPTNHEYLFTVPTVGQFDVSFDCWIRPIETEDNES
jgi:hypothetical protein